MLRKEPLSRHMPCRTGGPCHAYLVVHDREALSEALALCQKEGWRPVPLGAGTRTMVRDGGWAVAILRFGTGFSGVTQGAEGEWCVGASTPVPALIEQTMAAKAGGLLHLSCTPGSVGASLRLDEGWDEVVEEVEWMGRRAVQRTGLAEMRAQKSAMVLGARLNLPEVGSGYGQEVAAAWRRARPCEPGSWYRTDAGSPVRETLRKASLQRVRLRRVAIPSSAPELVVNLGGGTAADVALLQRCTVERVQRARGVKLESRMVWAGSHARGGEG